MTLCGISVLGGGVFGWALEEGRVAGVTKAVGGAVAAGAVDVGGFVTPGASVEGGLVPFGTRPDGTGVVPGAVAVDV